MDGKRCPSIFIPPHRLSLAPLPPLKKDVSQLFTVLHKNPKSSPYIQQDLCKEGIRDFQVFEVPRAQEYEAEGQDEWGG